MYPILFSFGQFHLFSFGVFLVLAWLVFSFTFWKHLRAAAVDDEKIFDMTFYATVASFIGARITYALLHWELFSASPLRIITIWVQPGLAWLGSLIAAVIVLFIVAKKLKVRFGLLMDTLAFTIPITMIVGSFGALLDGTEVGREVNLPWAISYVGHAGLRHPVQLYFILSLGLILLVLTFIQARFVKKFWPLGVLGIIFFLFYSISIFLIEFVKESGVYWLGLSVNQWVAIILFSQSVGALYVQSGIRNVIRPKVKALYATFNKRRT